MAGLAKRKMEDGLLHTELVEWCPVKLFENCHRLYVERCRRARPPVKTKDILSLYSMIDIWRSVCKTIQWQMSRGKGTKIDGVGIFTLDVTGHPCFFPDPMFRRNYGLQPARQPIKGSTLNVPVQFTSVDKATKGGAPRDIVENVLAAIPNAIRWALDHDVPSLMLQVGNVGEFVIGDGPTGDSGESERLVGVRFNAEFVSQIHNSLSVKAPSGLGAQIEKRRRKREAESKRQSQGMGLNGAAGGRRGGDARAVAASATDGVDGGKGQRAIELMRRKLFDRHGLYAVRDCRRSLKIIDDSGDGEVSPQELKQGFRTLGLALHPRLVAALFQMMDRDGGGSLSIDELYMGIRGTMSNLRNKLVQRCFDDLCKRAGPHKLNDGVSLQFITQEFNCDHFPSVKSGKKRFDDERHLFISQIDGDLVAPRDGYISREKFIDFFEDISGCYSGDGDEDNGDDSFIHFVREMWNFWNMRGFEPVHTPDVDDELEFDRPSTAASEASSERSAPVGGRREKYANGGAAPGRKRDPVPWECGHEWTHAEMRTSLASMPHRPPPRLGSREARQMASGGQTSSDGGLELNASIPPNVFGDMELLLLPPSDANRLEVDFMPPNDHWNELRRGLYEPKVPFHDFCKNLGLSGVGENPPVSEPALAARVYEAGRKLPGRWTQRMAQAVAKGIMQDAAVATWRPGGTAPGAADVYDDERPAVPVSRDGTSLPVKWLHGRLCELFGRDRISAKPKTVLDRLRKTLVDSCGPFGLGELRRHLALMDIDGNLTLDEQELKNGFQKMGLYLNNREMDEVFYEFDKDKSGAVSYDEFMDGIRGVLTEDRAVLVEQAWDLLCGGGNDVTIPVEDLARTFDCQW